MSDDRDDARMAVARAQAMPESQGGMSSTSKLILLGLAIGAGIVFMKQLPDLKRYLKMKEM